MNTIDCPLFPGSSTAATALGGMRLGLGTRLALVGSDGVVFVRSRHSWSSLERGHSVIGWHVMASHGWIRGTVWNTVACSRMSSSHTMWRRRTERAVRARTVRASLMRHGVHLVIVRWRWTAVIMGRRSPVSVVRRWWGTHGTSRVHTVSRIRTSARIRILIGGITASIPVVIGRRSLLGLVRFLGWCLVSSHGRIAASFCRRGRGTSTARFLVILYGCVFGGACVIALFLHSHFWHWFLWLVGDGMCLWFKSSSSSRIFRGRGGALLLLHLGVCSF